MKTTDAKLLKYQYCVLIPEKLRRSKYGSLKSGCHNDYKNNG